MTESPSEDNGAKSPTGLLGPRRNPLLDWVARSYLKKPDQSELLRIKFPTLSSMANAALNEAAFRTRASKSWRLTSLNLEVTNYCNLKCSFCPVNNGMERKKRYLDPGRFRQIVDATETLEFILPFQWGEPLLHPEIAEMIRYATDRGIRSYLTTNGTLLSEERCEALCRSGLERLTISIDGDDETHERIRGVPLDEIRDKIDLFKRVRERLGSPIGLDVSMVVEDRTHKAYQTFVREWQGRVDRVQAIPRFEDHQRTRACRELWRGTMVVMADGRVTVCCADSEGKLAIGHTDDQSPTALFNGKAMKELRRAHAKKCFPDICKNCGEYDATSLGVHRRFQ